MGRGLRTACAAWLVVACAASFAPTAVGAETVASAGAGAFNPGYVIALPPALAPIVERFAEHPGSPGAESAVGPIEPSALTTASLGDPAGPLATGPGARDARAVGAPPPVTADATGGAPLNEPAPLVIAPLPDAPGETRPLVEDVIAVEGSRLAGEMRRLAEHAQRVAEAARHVAGVAIEQDMVRAGIALRLSQPGWAAQRIAPTLAAEVAAFYAGRGHAALWYDGLQLNEAGRALMGRLARAHEDGLGPYDPVTVRAPDAAALAAAELRLSVAAVLFARDARGGRIDPRQLSRLITPKLDLPAPATVLASLGAAADPGEALAGYLPKHEGYRALRSKLAELRAEAGRVAASGVDAARARPGNEPAPAFTNRLPDGAPLRIGMRDPRVPLLRHRLGLGPEGSETYDRTLATRVAEFQRERGLPGAGVLNSATTAALNGARDVRMAADIIAAMERWRWLPDDLGDEHIIVNVPAFSMRKVERGTTVHEARVIVGRPDRPTPIFSDRMDHVVLNPSWTGPPTILREDYLPKLAADPGYAERKGLQVIRSGDRITLRQPPGPTNALGVIKFMFPNDHAVYLHDTPNRSQFAHQRRAYSSGCVRVERPLRLAELVLGGPESGWSEQRLRSLVGSGERTIRLGRQISIHLVYMTHVVEPDGRLVTYEDIYGFHRMTRQALGL